MPNAFPKLPNGERFEKLQKIAGVWQRFANFREIYIDPASILMLFYYRVHLLIDSGLTRYI